MNSGAISVAPGASPANLNVLVVDDDKETRDYVAAILRTAGYEVTVACSGAAALRELAPGRFNVVLTDLEMPGGTSGLALAIAARALSAPPVVIIMTGSAEPAVRVEVARLRIPLFFKPLDVDALLDELVLVQRARLEDGHARVLH